MLNSAGKFWGDIAMWFEYKSIGNMAKEAHI